MKKKVLIVPHDLAHLGGGSCVAVWLLEALKQDYEVSVLNWVPVKPRDLEFANRTFGTSLGNDEFRWLSVSAWARGLLRLLPFRLAHWQNQLMYRHIRRLLQREHYDVVFGAMNEIDVGRRAIQYVHYPWSYWPRPDTDLRWYHPAPLVHVYRWIGKSFAGYSKLRVAKNVTLVNSDWTGRVFTKWYGTPAKTVYPPVPGTFPDTPPEERENCFVCVGRLSPEKRQHELIEILLRVRDRHPDITFAIIGPVDSPQYTEKLYRLAKPHADWVSFHHDLPREKMLERMGRSRYGIHGMVQEHFGIAPAELQRAGCLTFVPDDGGPVEIVGKDERLIYQSVDDAVEKIVAVLSNPELEASIRKDLDRHKDTFSEHRFMQEIRDVVAEFLADTSGCGEGGSTTCGR